MTASSTRAHIGYRHHDRCANRNVLAISPCDNLIKSANDPLPRSWLVTPRGTIRWDLLHSLHHFDLPFSSVRTIAGICFFIEFRSACSASLTSRSAATMNSSKPSGADCCSCSILLTFKCERDRPQGSPENDGGSRGYCSVVGCLVESYEIGSLAAFRRLPEIVK